MSELTLGETAILLASSEASFAPQKFNCYTCITQYGTSERLTEKTNRKRQTKGCFDYKSRTYRLENFKYNNCIGNHAIPIDFYIDAFLMYEKGVLPFEGTLGDQPNKMIQIFGILYHRRKEHMDAKKGS